MPSNTREDATVARVTSPAHNEASAADSAAGDDDTTSEGVDGGVTADSVASPLDVPDTTVSPAPASPVRKRTKAPSPDDKLPVKMLNDRILVKVESDKGERRSTGGILIPATAQMGKRLAWARVVAVGPNVRAIEPTDQVLFNPEDRYEVEVRGEDYIILRERDIHALASKRLEEGSTGLYL